MAISLVNNGLPPITRTGFKTSGNNTDITERVSHLMKQAGEIRSKLHNDVTIARSERNSTTHKVYHKINKELQLLRGKMDDRIAVSEKHLHQDIASNLKFNGDSSVKMMLAQQLQGAQDKIALVNADKMYAQVLNEFPAKFMGISDDSKASLINRSLKEHSPELVERGETILNDLKHLAALEQSYADFKNELNQDVPFDLDRPMSVFDIEALSNDQELAEQRKESHD